MIYKVLKDKKIKVAISIIITLICMTSLWVTTNPNVFIVNTLCLWILGIMYLFIFLYAVIMGITLPQLNKADKSIFIVLGTVIITIITIYFIPISYEGVLKANYSEVFRRENNVVTIETVGEKNEISAGYVVQIDKATVNKVKYSLEGVTIPESWENTGEKLIGESSEISKFEIVFPENSNYGLFAKHDWNSGMVRITIGDKSKVFDLYSPTDPTIKELDLKPLFEPEKISINSFYKILFYCAMFIVIFLIELSLITYAYIVYTKNHRIMQKYNEKELER